MSVIWEQRNLYLHGWLVTAQLCVFSALFALALGTLMATFRVSPIGMLRWWGASWVTIFRNIPLTVLAFLVAFGVPELGGNFDYRIFMITSLALYTSAFVCEAVRSGINTVPVGQAEAARALGFTFHQNLRLIVLPQAFRATLPPLVSVLIAMVKNSAIAGFVGVAGDLSGVGQTLTSAQGYAAVPVLFGVVLGFWTLTLPLAALAALLEKRTAVIR